VIHCRHLVAHRGVIGCRRGCGVVSMTDTRVDRRQLVLHAVVLGAHSDRLHINGVLEPLEPLRSGGLGVRCVVVPLAISGRRAATASAGNDTFNICWTDHVGMVVDVDEIVGPVNMDAGDVRLGAQGAFDRVGALDAVHIFEPELCVLFDPWPSMCHDSTPLSVDQVRFINKAAKVER
jgi:hypothetical protein